MKGYTKKIRRLLRLAMRRSEFRNFLNEPLQDLLKARADKMLRSNPHKLTGYLQVFRFYKHYKTRAAEDYFLDEILPVYHKELQKTLKHLEEINLLIDPQERAKAKVQEEKKIARKAKAEAALQEKLAKLEEEAQKEQKKAKRPKRRHHRRLQKFTQSDSDGPSKNLRSNSSATN